MPTPLDNTSPVAPAAARPGGGAPARAGRTRTRLSPSGLVFLAGTLAIGLLAHRTGNNFYYALFAIFLSAAALSRVHPWLSARGLSVARELPAEVFAGAPARVRIEARNGSRWWSAWAVTVRDLLDAPVLRDDPFPFFPRIPAGRAAEAAYTVRFRRRGRYRARAYEVRTAFPFGFFSRRGAGASETAFTVFPRPRPVPAFLRPPESDEAAWGPQPCPARGEEDELRELRDYRPGDPVRMIHWKTSARANTLMVREMETSRRPRITILLDTASGSGSGRLRRRVGLERGVRVAASLAMDLEKRGFTFRFGAFAPETLLSPFGRGSGHLRGVLEALAGLGPTPGRGADDLVREAVRRCGPGTRFVVLLLDAGRAGAVREAAAGAAPGSVQAFDVSKPGMPRVV